MTHRLIVFVATVLHRAYKLTLSPLLGDVCRFTPYCSDYALEAVKIHGAIKGSWLALRRVSKCHALNPGGFDPVPGTGVEERRSTENRQAKGRHQLADTAR